MDCGAEKRKIPCVGCGNMDARPYISCEGVLSSVGELTSLEFFPFHCLSFLLNPKEIGLVESL